MLVWWCYSRGFSLIEILLTLALIVVIGGFVFSSLIRGNERLKIRSALEQFPAVLQHAQTYALTHKTVAYVGFSVDSEKQGMMSVSLMADTPHANNDSDKELLSSDRAALISKPIFIPLLKFVNTEKESQDSRVDYFPLPNTDRLMASGFQWRIQGVNLKFTEVFKFSADGKVWISEQSPSERIQFALNAFNSLEKKPFCFEINGMTGKVTLVEDP